MIPWLKELFTDETAFVRLVRAAAIAFGTAYAGGYLPLPDKWKWAGVLVAGAGGFLPAGQKNPKGQVLDATFGETREDPPEP